MLTEHGVRRDIDPEEPGTHQHPISVPDQEERQQLFDKYLVRARNQGILRAAKLCNNSEDLVIAIAKTKMPGNLKQKEEGIQQELRKYFNRNTGIDMISGHYEPKIEADLSQTRLAPIALMVHGVDFLKTRNVGYMFSVLDQDPRTIIHKIIWFNESSCVVIFFNPPQAQMALKHLILDQEKYKLKVEEEGTELPKDWFELKPYNVLGVKRNLIVRYATMNELEKPKAEQGKQSRFDLFDSARGKLQLYLLDKFNGHQDYKDITRELKYKKYSQAMFEKPRFSFQSRALTDSKRFYDYIEQRAPKTMRSTARSVANEGVNLNDVSVIDGANENQEGGRMIVQENNNINNKSIIIDMLDEDEEQKIPPTKNVTQEIQKVSQNVAEQKKVQVPQSLPNQDVVRLLSPKQPEKLSKSFENVVSKSDAIIDLDDTPVKSSNAQEIILESNPQSYQNQENRGNSNQVNSEKINPFKNPQMIRAKNAPVTSKPSSTPVTIQAPKPAPVVVQTPKPTPIPHQTSKFVSKTAPASKPTNNDYIDY